LSKDAPKDLEQYDMVFYYQKEKTVWVGVKSKGNIVSLEWLLKQQAAASYTEKKFWKSQLLYAKYAVLGRWPKKEKVEVEFVSFSSEKNEDKPAYISRKRLRKALKTVWEKLSTP
jgi:hypothetical protein